MKSAKTTQKDTKTYSDPTEEMTLNKNVQSLVQLLKGEQKSHCHSLWERTPQYLIFPGKSYNTVKKKSGTGPQYSYK